MRQALDGVGDRADAIPMARRRMGGRRELVVPEGLEPPTPTLGMWRSILLSYGTGCLLWEAVSQAACSAASTVMLRSPKMSYSSDARIEIVRSNSPPSA